MHRLHRAPRSPQQLQLLPLCLSATAISVVKRNDPGDSAGVRTVSATITAATAVNITGRELGC